MATTWRQDKFAFRNDDGSETTATYTSGCANYTVPIYGDRNIRVRIAVSEQGTTAAALTPWLRIQMNGAGGYYSASACSGSGIYPIASANFADGDATTKQINPVTFVAGSLDEIDGKCGATASIARYSGTEAEYNLRISASTVTDGTYFDFRVYNQTTALNTYSATGRLTIAKWAGINDATQAQTADNCTITATGPSYTLTIQDATQAQQADNTVLSYHESALTLAINDATQIQITENTSLTQHYILVSKDATQAQTAENTVLTQHYVLSAKDATQAQTAENTTLTYHPKYTLTIADATQAQTADNTVIDFHPLGATTVVIANASQAQTADNTVLTQHYALSTNNATQSISSDNIALTQHYTLTVVDAYQLIFSDTATLIVPVTGWTLEIEDAWMVQTVEFIYPPADVWVGDFSKPDIVVTKPVIENKIAEVVNTRVDVRVDKPEIEVKKVY